MINVVAQFKTILANGISKTSTGGVLDSNSSSDNDGATLPNGQYGIVIDERNSSREYAIIELDGFNFTFVKRGLSVIDGSTEKEANKFDHRKGAEIKIVSHPIIPLMTKTFNGLEPFGGIPLLPADRAFTDPRQVVDKEYADAIASAGILAMLVSEGTGLTVNINAGTYLLNGVVKNFSAVSGVAISDDATNYIQIKDGLLEVNVTGFEDDTIPLAEVTTSSGSLLTITDKRPFYTGVDVKESGGISRDANGIFVNIGASSGLEVDEEDSLLKVKIKDGGGLSMAEDGIGVNGTYSFDVGEELAQGDFVKTLEVDSLTKIFKVIGIKDPVTHSVSKAGSIIQVKRVSSSKIVILTSTKLYVAQWDGTTLGTLTDITPAFVPTSFDVLDSSRIATVRFAVVTSPTYTARGYVSIINVETQSIGGENVVDITTGYSSLSAGTSDIVCLDSSTIIIATSGARENYTTYYRAVVGAVSGTSVSFGSVSEFAGGYDSNASYEYYSRVFVKVDSTHVATILMYRRSQAGNYLYEHRVAFIKNTAGVLSTNTYSIVANGTSQSGQPSALTFSSEHQRLVVICNLDPGSTTYFRSASVSGDTLVFAAAYQMPVNYNVNEIVVFKKTLYIRVGSSFYVYLFDGSSTQKLIGSATLSNFAVLDKTPLNDSFFIFSDDAAIKTTRFLLDHQDFVSIAERAYSVDEKYSLAHFFTKQNLLIGATYYLAANGQSLSYESTYKKVGRAVSNSVIIKE